MIRVGVIDDHALFLTVFTSFLRKYDDLEISFSTGNAGDVLDLVRDHPLDVLIVDLSLKDCNGVMIVDALALAGLDVPVLFFSAFAYPELALTWDRQPNVAGYILKTGDPDEAVDAIRRVARGERGIFSPEIASSLQQMKKGQAGRE